ncbi:DUF2855 family protein [Caenimonas sp. SL110]|uniref:DUF2855 family protein n=1 Tax=Caenimonas sp. SL110 TaxID=1450524 RepID=UPI000652B0E5|nr:DUF2855 family protein [Caenimonas sp. SL110]
MTTTTLLVQHNALANTRIDSRDDTPLSEGQVRVHVDSFALTANNITYAAFGDAMNYWRFFPTGEAGWGIIPVWGFGTVVQSLHPGIAVGEKLYGYWPMSNMAVLQPARVTENGFYDAAPHRAELHSLYNQYLRSNTDPFHKAGTEDTQSLLRPLFITSWLIDDFLADNDFFGANTVLLSSASSKTAYGTAFMLKQRQGIEVVGLTSPSNRAFCESLGCYSRVLTYDELDQVPADTACVYTDFAGNAALRMKIHSRFANLKHSCSIGGTHVDKLGGAKDLPGPRATLFFAPAQVKKRQGEWGPAELGKRLVQAWHAFSDKATSGASPWLQVQTHSGAAAVQQAYAAVLAGKGDPREGHILSL